MRIASGFWRTAARSSQTKAFWRVEMWRRKVRRVVNMGRVMMVEIDGNEGGGLNFIRKGELS